MAIITLTSDWGSRDYYAGAVKGVILKLMPAVTIVDISHQITPHDLNEAAFIVRNAWGNFPEGTVHIIDINSDASIKNPHTVILHHGHHFIGADNGIFSLIFEEKLQRIIEIDMIQDSNYFTFPARDLFAKVACHILAGKPLEEIGPERSSVMVRTTFKPVVTGNLIKGQVIHIDHYGNAITNITEGLFRKNVRNQPFNILFRSPNNRVNVISESYKDVKEGEIVALFSATGCLEIALRNDNGSNLLGLHVNQPVTIEIL
jgi:S-adenosylmethionine hydrolase